MNYTYETKKDAVKVNFIDENKTYISENDGVLTLNIKAKDINKRKFIKLCRKVVQEAKPEKIGKNS